MPWWCTTCRRFNEKRFKVCPYCGRPKKGRVCTRCQEPAPKDAVYCVRCGTDRLTEAGTKWRLPWQVRLPLWLGVGLILWLAFQLLKPFLLAFLSWIVVLILRILFGVILFWLFTALLPESWGRLLRRVALGFLRLLARLLGNLVGC